jgi:hypothetical protein
MSGSGPIGDGQSVLEFSWLTAHGRAASRRMPGRESNRSNSVKNSMSWSSEAENYPLNYPLKRSCLLEETSPSTVAGNARHVFAGVR